MDLKQLTCPNCGENVEYEDGVNATKCTLCESSIAINEDGIGSLVNIEELLIDANESMSSGRLKEALEGYNEILQFFDGNWEALYGKGVALGKLSSVADFRFEEAIQCIERAVCNAPMEMKEKLRLEAAEELEKIALILYMAIYRQFNNFRVQSTFQIMIKRMRVILMAYELASIYKPDDINLLKKRILVFKTCIKKYTDSTTELELGLPAKALASFELAKTNIQTRIKEIVLVKPDKEDACYIATKVYGSYDYPEVMVLRYFRDNYLQKKAWGRIVIKVYYFVGPILAERISNTGFINTCIKTILNKIVKLLNNMN